MNAQSNRDSNPPAVAPEKSSLQLMNEANERGEFDYPVAQERPTPMCNQARALACECHGAARVVPLETAQMLEVRLAEANEKLAFLKSKGIVAGLLKSSDKPEPYLAYII